MLAAVRCTETDRKGLKIAAAAATATAVTAFFYIPLYSSKLVTELTPPPPKFKSWTSTPSNFTKPTNYLG